MIYIATIWYIEVPMISPAVSSPLRYPIASYWAKHVPTKPSWWSSKTVSLVWSTMAHFVVVLHGTPPITVLPKSHDLLKNGCYRWNPPFLCVPIHWIVLVTFYQSQIRVHSQFHTLQSPFKNSSPLIFHRKIRPFWCLQSAFSRARLSPTRPRRVRRTCPPGTTLRRPGTRSLKP